jgi:hypothetical protein
MISFHTQNQQKTRIIISACFLILSASLTLTMAVQASSGTPTIGRRSLPGLFYTESAKTLGGGHMVISVNGQFAWDQNYIRSWKANTVVNPQDSAIPFPLIFGLQPGLAIGLGRAVDLSASVPFYFEKLTAPANDMFATYPSQAGLGDVEACLKIRIVPFPGHDSVFQIGILGDASFPTGSKTAGYFPRHTYYFFKDTTGLAANYSSGATEIGAKTLWTLDLGELNQRLPLTINLNYGFRFVMHNKLDNFWILDASFDYRPVTWFDAFTEISTEIPMRNLGRLFDKRYDPFRLSPGISFISSAGLFLTIGGHLSFTGDSLLEYHPESLPTKTLTVMGEPRWTMAATIGWNIGFSSAADADKDGIKDSQDKCPKATEDIDGFEDEDGCPDPDNDKDGICDPWITEQGLGDK